MRAQGKRVHHEEEEESAFVSMTDMTVGFLFIMMILLAFFVSQTRETETVPRELYEGVKQERDDALKLAETQAEKIIRLEIELAKLREERAALVKERNQLSKELESARSQVTTLSARIKNLEETLAKLLAKLVMKDSEIETLRTEIKELRIEIDKLQKIDPLEEYLKSVADARKQILTDLKRQLEQDFKNLTVELIERSGALRFQGEGLFPKNESYFEKGKGPLIEGLGIRLNEVISCYTTGPRSTFSQRCNPDFVLIEAIQIEGHTDSEGREKINRNLSAERANETFFTIKSAAPNILDHENLEGQPVLSVAAYGPDRPVTSNETKAGRARNRRIDLRFIMVTPQDTDGIETIRDALSFISEIPQ